MTLAEYDALLIGWAETHKNPDDVDAPDLDFVKSEMARLRNSPATR